MRYDSINYSAKYLKDYNLKRQKEVFGFNEEDIEQEGRTEKEKTIVFAFLVALAVVAIWASF